MKIEREKVKRETDIARKKERERKEKRQKMGE